MLLIDEADYILLNHALLIDHEHVVALSATSFTKDYVDETKFITSLNFKCIDSKISGAINSKTATTDCSDVEQFLQHSRNFAKIIYNTNPDFTFECTMKDCRDLSRLKALTSSDILLITEAELARGIDYRVAPNSETEGISLFVMSKAANLRAYVQLLGRVGRYKEECKRFKWTELKDPIDRLAQARMLLAL